MANDNLEQVQKTSQSFTPSLRLRQALKVLQSPAFELRNAILQELESNPVLEELPLQVTSIEPAIDSDSKETDQEGGELDFDETLEVLQKSDQDGEKGSTEPSYSSEDIQHRQYFFDSLVAESTLQEHLMEQAQQSGLLEEELRSMQYLIGSLDDSGFLTSDLSELAALSDSTLPILQKAAELLKTFDPPGIGAADIKECLLIQLELQGKGDSLAAQILRDHYEQLLHHRIVELSRELSVPTDAIQKAIETIASLDPAPGRQFAEDNNQTVAPDVVIRKEGDKWLVTLKSDYIPKLRISSLYKSLLAKSELGTKEREYIRQKIRAGKYLIDSIAQRQQTVERIARAILQFQKDFFEEGVSKLRPLTMREVAELMDVHETTVSRAIANKYMDTPWGLFAFKYFFTGGYEDDSGQSISRTTIKETIARLIRKERSDKPLSDPEIVEALGQRGIKIARRTIAKYREELGILPNHLRRRY